MQNFGFILSLFSFVTTSWIVMKIKKLLEKQPTPISTSYVMVSLATSLSCPLPRTPFHVV